MRLGTQGCESRKQSWYSRKTLRLAGVLAFQPKQTHRASRCSAARLARHQVGEVKQSLPDKRKRSVHGHLLRRKSYRGGNSVALQSSKLAPSALRFARRERADACRATQPPDHLRTCCSAGCDQPGRKGG